MGGNNPELLSIAEKQAEVTLDDAGLSVALGLKEGRSRPFIKRSVELSDGANGDEGAVGILRTDGLELVFKYTAHGLSHGHYDKLSFALFENGEEVIQDYGMARFVNIEQKGGGNYLKENTTWAKQSISHNTLVQNETSHFQGDYDIGSKYHSERYIFNAENESLQVVSAKEYNAYPGTEMHRTLVMINDNTENKPYILDILKVSSEGSNQYDLPLYYLGHIMQTSFETTKLDSPEVLGDKNGYQHLFKEAFATASGEPIKLNWLLNNKFYTYSAVTSNGDELILGRIGANDPNFNLRSEPTFIIRKKNTKNAIFASVIESHGTYNPVSELATSAYSNIDNIEILNDDQNYSAIKISAKTGEENLFVIANKDNSNLSTHKLTVKGVEYSWKGPYKLIKIKSN